MAKGEFHRKEAKKPKKDSKKPVLQSTTYVNPEPEVVRRKKKPREDE
jgi:hypothetical protein